MTAFYITRSESGPFITQILGTGQDMYIIPEQVSCFRISKTIYTKSIFTWIDLPTPLLPHPPPQETFGYPTTVVIIMDRLYPRMNFQEVSPPAPVYVHSIATHHPAWEAELLAGIQLLQPLTVVNRHICTGNIMTCSDGSVIANSSSFGYVVSTKQGLRLLTGCGTVPGAYGNSFRSEAYGVLAMLVWLRQAIRGNKAIMGSHNRLLRHYLDNKSVIHRLKEATQSFHQKPNDQLRPEHDVIQEMVAILANLPWQVEFEWVRGHQDSGTPFHRLPLPAQLNCEADAIATAYARRNGPSALTVTPLPHTPCQLLIQMQSITRSIKQRSISAATLPTYYAYIQRRFKWTEEVLQTIDWSQYSTILSKYRNKWPTIVKHIHNISPTGHIAHRNDPSHPSECPVCDTMVEDNAHVLLCKAPSRARWRAQMMQKLHQKDNNQSDPVLMDILQDGVRRYFLSLSPPDPTNYPEQYTTLITHQNNIGWEHLFKARWGIQWDCMQETYRNNSTANTTALPGSTWVYRMGRLLLDEWLDLWKLRNMERHGEDQIQQEAFWLKHITKELTALYSYKMHVCPPDRSLFYDSVEEHLQRHTHLTQVEDWITLYKDAIRSSAQQAIKLGVHRNRTILDYPMFNPAILTGQQASLPAGLPSG